MLNEDVEKELLEKASFYAKEQLKKMGTAEFFDNYANIKNISKFKAFWVGYDKAYPVVYKNLSDNIFLTLKEEYIKEEEKKKAEEKKAEEKKKKAEEKKKKAEEKIELDKNLEIKNEILQQVSLLTNNKEINTMCLNFYKEIHNEQPSKEFFFSIETIMDFFLQYIYTVLNDNNSEEEIYFTTCKKISFEKNIDDYLLYGLYNSEIWDYFKVSTFQKTKKDYYLTHCVVLSPDAIKKMTGEDYHIVYKDEPNKDYSKAFGGRLCYDGFKELFIKLFKIVKTYKLGIDDECLMYALFVNILTERNKYLIDQYKIMCKDFGLDPIAYNKVINEFVKRKVSNKEAICIAVYLTYSLKKYKTLYEACWVVYKKIQESKESLELESLKNKLLQEQLNPFGPTINDIDLFAGVRFESFMGELFEKSGYEVSYTSTSGDQGVDLLVKKDGYVTAIQLKRHAQPISNKAIQEVVAGVAYYKADKGMVITNNYFTQSAKDLAYINGIMLWDRERLVEILQNGSV